MAEQVPANLQNRKHIFITSIEGALDGKSDTEYVNTIKLKYGGTCPYHYIITASGTIYGRTSTSLALVGVPAFTGFENDIFILVQGDVFNLSSAQKTSIAQTCILLCRKCKFVSSSVVRFWPNEKSKISGNIFWNAIRTAVTDGIIAANPYLSAIAGGTNNNLGSVFPSPSMNTMSKIAASYSVDLVVLKSYNPHITTLEYNAIPNTKPVFYPIILSTSAKAIATEANKISANALQTVKINYWNGSETDTYGTSIKSGKIVATANQTVRIKKAVTLPGYENAVFEFIDPASNKRVDTITFAVSPSGFVDSRSNMQQINKTNGGWFVMRIGKNLANINLTGYMIDSKYNLERHSFLEKYKQKIEDKRNNTMEYTNQYAVNLIIEGRKYNGFIQSISFQKTAIQPFLYQYSITFLSLDDRIIYTAAPDDSDYLIYNTSTEEVIGQAATAEEGTVVHDSVIDLFSYAGSFDPRVEA